MSNGTNYIYEFVGREEELDAFHSLRSLREQKNVLYLEADGGLGKTKALNEFIKQCKQQRRPWHFSPLESEIEPIIDFYDFENRTVAGLRRSIAQRFGESHFHNFRKKDKDLRDVEATNLPTSEKGSLLALKLETERVFFQDFKRALREVRNYAVLFFDTFEVVYNRHVGRWFLEEFLPSPSTIGSLIVFAGRPRAFDLPLNVNHHKVKPFTEAESYQYFQKKWGIQPAQPEAAIIQISEGRPLIMDLAVHYVRVLNGKIEDLRGKLKPDIERELVTKFVTVNKPEYEIIQDMGYLKRRYNHAIFERRRADYTTEAASLDYESIGAKLKDLPFVKYHKSDNSYALHDEFQRMIADYAPDRREWRDLANDLSKDIVLEWYPKTISRVENEVEGNLLRAEQLAYILERDFGEGLSQYQSYFEAIKTHSRFEFNDLLWGEVQEHLGKDEIAYNLMSDQADWRFDNQHYSDAIHLFEQLTGIEFQDVQTFEKLVDDIISLGHCYLHSGEVRLAGETFESGLASAIQRNDIGDQALFEYNLGHVRYRQGQWDEAASLYDLAIKKARSVKKLDSVGETLYVLARLHARQGKYEKAFGEIKHSLEIVSKRYPGQDDEAIAFIFAGDIYRYAGNVEAAQKYYQQAGSIFDKVGGQYGRQAQAKAGLGATYSLLGVRKRIEWNDLAGDIQDQTRAFETLVESLNILREHNLESYLNLIFDRLADIYVEAYYIESTATDPQIIKATADLRSRLLGLNLIEETSWSYGLRELEKPFNSLDILGAAQRLFEIASLQSDTMHELHQVFDSLIEAATVAQLRGRKADLDFYAALASTLHGIDDPTQEEILSVFLEILKAHLAFDEDSQTAITRYATAMFRLFEISGFASFLARRQLPEIKKHLLSLSSDKARNYCGMLASAWQNSPDLLEFIQTVEDQMDIYGEQSK